MSVCRFSSCEDHKFCKPIFRWIPVCFRNSLLIEELFVRRWNSESFDQNHNQQRSFYSNLWEGPRAYNGRCVFTRHAVLPVSHLSHSPSNKTSILIVWNEINLNLINESAQLSRVMQKDAKPVLERVLERAFLNQSTFEAKLCKSAN